MAGYIGVDGKAGKVMNLYVGVDGTARRVVKAYVGDENGKARLWYGQSPVTFTLRLGHAKEGEEETDIRDTVCQALEGMTAEDWLKSKEFYSRQKDWAIGVVIIGDPATGTMSAFKLTSLLTGFKRYTALDPRKPIYLRDGAVYDSKWIVVSEADP